MGGADVTARENTVPPPPEGFVIALQFYAGDKDRALRLARLIANIEPEVRRDVALAVCPRFDIGDCDDIATTMFDDIATTMFDVMKKIPALLVESDDPTGVGHPEGANGLWSFTFNALAEMWQAGRLNYGSVFFIEPDGCPLRRDWISVLLNEHRRTLEAGKRVTGAVMHQPDPTRSPHVNGSLIAHLSLWADRPSLHRTPADQAWDLFHAPVLMAEVRETSLVRNIYGATEYTPPVLAALARQTAFLASTKDDSTIEWAESALVGR